MQVGDEEEAAKPKYNPVIEMEEDFVHGLAATATTICMCFPKSFDVCMVGLGYLLGT